MAAISIEGLLEAFTNAKVDSESERETVLQAYSTYISQFDAVICESAVDADCSAHILLKPDESSTVYTRSGAPNDWIEKRYKAKTVEFFSRLGGTRLQKLEVDAEADSVWVDADQAEIANFLPDDDDYKMIAPMLALRSESKIDTADTKEQMVTHTVEQLSSCTDAGDVLWRLKTQEVGFPLPGDGASSDCVLREHHRQVMYHAVEWLAETAASQALSIKDQDIPIPESVIATVCGSAGIGKSRSLIFLMWFCMQKKNAFLLEAGNEGNRRFILVRPRQDTVTFLTNETAKKILEEDRSILTIMDPRHFTSHETVTPLQLLKARGIVGLIARSPDTRHLPRGKTVTIRHFYVSPWLLNQLLEVLPLFQVSTNSVEEEELRKRFAHVGGIPRAIFRTQTYTERMKDIASASLQDIRETLVKTLLTKNEELLADKTKPPQAFLAYFSEQPFTLDHTRVDFLSQASRHRIGSEIYSHHRSAIAMESDSSSAGLFFERWVGSILASGDDSMKALPFVLKEFVNGKECVPAIDLPAVGSVERFDDESVLLNRLIRQGDGGASMFPKRQVLEPPPGTAVYDYMLSSRWAVQVTMQNEHGISRAGMTRLLRILGATPADPIHIVFFVLDAQKAVLYSKRKLGEAFNGQVQDSTLTAEQTASLKRSVNNAPKCATSTGIAEYVEALSTCLKIELMKEKKRRTKQGFSNAPSKKASGQLMEEILTALQTAKSGKIEVKWARICSAIDALPDDPTAWNFDASSVKQHVVTLVPRQKDDDDV
jgi:hypothetical protein